MVYLREATAVIKKLGPFVDSGDGSTAETGLTISQADIQLSKNGGAFAQTSDAAPTTTHDADGWYPIPLTTTDTATLGSLVVQVTESGALPVWREYMVVPANVYDSLVLGSDSLEVDATAISGDTTAANNLESQFDGTGLTGDTYPATQAQVGSAVVEYPDDGREMSGTTQTNTYAKLAVSDDDYWICTDPDTSNPLEMCVYVNAGANTFPDAVVIEARYNAQNNRRVHVFAANVDDVAAASGTTATATNASPSVLTQAGAFTDLTLAGFDIYITSGTNATAGFYTIASHTDNAITLDRNCTSGVAATAIDFIVMVWDQISNDANAILHKNGDDAEYEYPLGVSYMTTDNNEVFLRFSDEGQGTFKTSYDLRLDQVGVITKSLAGGSVSVETIAAAVHTELDDHFRHIPSFTGEISYVSSAGSDGNSGHDPATPLLTIGAAVSLAAAGDYIKVFSSEFTEAVVLNKNGLELHGEIGARITGDGGVPLTITADYCRVDELILTPTAGQVALLVSGDYNKIQILRTIGGTIAVQDTGTGNEITLVAATEYTATGFDLQGRDVYVCDCLAASSQASTRGYWLGNAVSNRTVVNRSTSVNNDTAGFEVDSGVTNATFTGCTESPTCGARVDNGTNTAWRDHSSNTLYTPDASSTVTDGTEMNGSTYVDAKTPGGDPWVIQMESDNDTTINLICEFNMGANRITTQVDITGYFDAGGVRAVTLYAWNYTTGSYDALSHSSAAEEMRHASGNQNYTFPLSAAHTDLVTTPGEVKLLFFSDDAIDEDDLYLDYVRITGVTTGAITPEAVASAVWDHDVSASLGAGTAAHSIYPSRAVVATVKAIPSPTTTVFGVNNTVAVEDAYTGMIIMVEDATDGNREVRRIKSWAEAREATVDRAFSFLPAEGDIVLISAAGYGGSLDTIEAAVVDLYHADVFLTIDGGNTRDEYTVVWYKNGVPVTASITNPDLTVISRDGSTLVDDVTMTQLGSTGAYIWNEPTNRLTAGDAALALVSATIDASTRTWRVPIGRDLK